MNRLAGIVAGTALAGGEDKWYQDSARFMSYKCPKAGRPASARRPPTCGPPSSRSTLPIDVVKLIAEHAPDGAVHPFALDEEKV